MSKTSNSSFEMREALRFVRGAVARRDHVPELTHFLIDGGTITGFNGFYALRSPIPTSISVAPSALPFIKAVTACGDEEPQLSLTNAGHLRVRCARFQTIVPCVPAKDFPQPPGLPASVPVLPEILDVLGDLEPFIGVDASRPWCCGVRFDGRSAFATNNIVVVERWHGQNLTEPLNIPAQVIKELLRLKVPPEGIAYNEGAIRFDFPGGRSLQSQLYVGEWPDIAGLLNKLEAAFVEVEPDMVEALETLTGFATDKLRKCYLRAGEVSTEREPGVGTDVPAPCGAGGVFSVDALLSVLRVATTVGLENYPAAVPFIGDKIRGALLGYRES